MNKYYSEIIGRLVENRDIKRITKFVSPKLIIRATQKSFGGKPRSITGNLEITLTIGKPNYLERNFIEQCKKAGEPFPVKMIQIKYYKNKK